MNDYQVFSKTAPPRSFYLRQMKLYYAREAKRQKQEMSDFIEENPLAKYIIENPHKEENY